PIDGVRGQARTFTLTATDPSSVDQAAGFTFVINWGDGMTQTVPGPSGTQVSHAYLATGPFSVQLTAHDRNRDTGPAAATSLTIGTMQLQADPLAPGRFLLAYGDSDAGNMLRFRATSVPGEVQVVVNNVQVGLYTGGVVGRILVYGNGGDDNIE